MKIRIKDLIPKKGIIRRYKTYDGDIYKADEVDRYIAHQKMKRCLAMAEMCEERSERYFSWSKKMDFILKWKLRWLELAEKFKEMVKCS